MQAKSLQVWYIEVHDSVCREADITKDRIQKILATGANVILTTGGIENSQMYWRWVLWFITIKFHIAVLVKILICP